MGAFFACWGTTLPALRGFLDINIEMAAILTAFGQAGHAVFCLVGGIVSDFHRRDRILMFGCLFLGTGVLFLGHLDAYAANVLLVLWMGAGSGFILSSSNALLVGLYPDRKGPIMNFHHGVFGLFSLVSPVIMGYLLTHGNRWESGYRGLGVLLLLTGLFFLFTHVHRGAPRGLNTFAGDFKRLLTDFNFVPLMLIGFLAMGTQFALMFLSVSFLSDAKGFPIFQASMVLSAFYVFLFVGRLICGWFAIYVFSSRILFLLLFFQAGCMLVAWKGHGWVSAVALAVSGLACSGIFPCLLALVGTLYYEMAGTSLGLLATVNSLGSVVIIWFSGLLSERVDSEFGFVAMVVGSFLAAVLFSVKYRVFLAEEMLKRKAA